MVKRVIHQNGKSLKQLCAVKAKRMNRQIVEVLKWGIGVMANSDDGEMAKSMIRNFKGSTIRRTANKVKRMKCYTGEST